MKEQIKTNIEFPKIYNLNLKGLKFETFKNKEGEINEH